MSHEIRTPMNVGQTRRPLVTPLIIKNPVRYQRCHWLSGINLAIRSSLDYQEFLWRSQISGVLGIPLIAESSLDYQEFPSSLGVLLIIKDFLEILNIFASLFGTPLIIRSPLDYLESC